MQIILDSSFGMASEKVTHELTPVAERLAPLSNGKSVVWNYFRFIPNLSGKVEDKKKVYCKLCDTLFALSYSLNMSNLTYHLDRKHPEEHKKVLSAHS